MKHINIIILSLVLLSACNLFTTRSPEDPDTKRSTFQPPTSPDIVISNFQNSIKEKNAENYTACLADTSQTDSQQFAFIPSTEALARFSAIFQSWSITTERNTFISMVSNIPKDKTPELTFENPRFEVLMPDSAVYITDYKLNIPHNLVSLPNNYADTLQFTLMPRSNGLWSIRRWIDTSPTNDTITDSWSILKANFAN